MSSRIKFEKDFLEFISLCNKHKVEYLVIGGYAVAIHGYPRYTKDIDVSIQISAKNAEAMIKKCRSNDRGDEKFGFASLNLTSEDFTKVGGFIQLGYEPLRIDIVNDLDGVSFEKALKNKTVVEYEGVSINFIGYEDLIKNKQYAGRSQDIVDIEKLKERNKKK
jgi:predicted nucleotidyltransferase